MLAGAEAVPVVQLIAMYVTLHKGHRPAEIVGDRNVVEPRRISGVSDDRGGDDDGDHEQGGDDGPDDGSRDGDPAVARTLVCFTPPGSPSPAVPPPEAIRRNGRHPPETVPPIAAVRRDRPGRRCAVHRPSVTEDTAR